MDELTVLFLNNGIRKYADQMAPFYCYVVPREAISIASNEIKNQLCLYFLVDSNEGLYDTRKIYIGETTNFTNRMNDHRQKKKWWNEVIVFCAPKPKFTSDTILGLEKIMIDKYRSRLDLYDIDNSKASATIIDSACYKFDRMIQEFLDYLRYGINIESKVEEKKSTTELKTKREPFKFSMCGIKAGDRIQLIKKPDLTITVKDEKHVLYENQVYSLSTLAQKLLELNHPVQGPICFSYNGVDLDSLRKKRS